MADPVWLETVEEALADPRAEAARRAAASVLAPAWAMIGEVERARRMLLADPQTNYELAAEAVVLDRAGDPQASLSRVSDALAALRTTPIKHRAWGITDGAMVYARYGYVRGGEEILSQVIGARTPDREAELIGSVSQPLARLGLGARIAARMETILPDVRTIRSGWAVHHVLSALRWSGAPLRDEEPLIEIFRETLASSTPSTTHLLSVAGAVGIESVAKLRRMLEPRPPWAAEPHHGRDWVSARAMVAGRLLEARRILPGELEREAIACWNETRPEMRSHSVGRWLQNLILATEPDRAAARAGVRTIFNDLRSREVTYPEDIVVATALLQAMSALGGDDLEGFVDELLEYLASQRDGNASERSTSFRLIGDAVRLFCDLGIDFVARAQERMEALEARWPQPTQGWRSSAEIDCRHADLVFGRTEGAYEAVLETLPEGTRDLDAGWETRALVRYLTRDQQREILARCFATLRDYDETGYFLRPTLFVEGFVDARIG